VDAPAPNSEEFFEGVTDEQIHHLTASGIPGTEMPAWWNELGGPLTDEQIRALVAFIRSWEPSAPSRPDWRMPEGSGGSDEHAD
jgi:mono/diheme cytochrome c family protein